MFLVSLGDWERGEKYVLDKQIATTVGYCLLFILFSAPMFFQTALPHVQAPEGTDSECIECTFLPEKRTHWSCRDCIQSTAGTCGGSVTQLFLEEDVGLLTWACNFKKQKTYKNKKKQSVAARLGDDFEMGQSSNEFIYRFHEEQAS